MKKKIIIFGLNDFAELAHYYISNDTNDEVIAFCVNKEFLPELKYFKGLPIVSFEDIEDIFPADSYHFFAPMAPNKMNQQRQSVYERIKTMGYRFYTYVSTKATVLTDKIGDNCFILEDNTIQPFVTIHNNVMIWSGNHIGHHSTVENHVMITSHVVISGHCIIGSNSILGVNSAIRDGVNIAQGTFVAMASCILQNTEAWSYYKGNPASNMQKSTIDFK